MSITVEHITKTYGEQKAVDDVSFSIPRGQTCGFLGPNGAGKSTVMKIMTGFLTPDAGSVTVNDISMNEYPQLAKQMIGYLPEHNPLYHNMYVREFLNFTSKLYGGSVPKNRIEETIDLVALRKESHKKIGALSKGYKQRVGLAQAMIHDPQVLILDEPLSGLDPNQLAEIRELIIELGKEKTLLFSSHILQEVEQVANRIILIKDGKLVHDSTQENTHTVRRYIFIELAKTPSIELIEKLAGLGAIEYDGGKIFLEQHGKNIRKQVFEIVKQSENSLLTLQEEQEDLSQLFQSKTQRG